jgi:uncharacterized protein (DUF1778 family)
MSRDIATQRFRRTIARHARGRAAEPAFPPSRAALSHHIRIKPGDRALIDQAAAAQGKKRSEFMLEASRRGAEETLLDQALLRVDSQTYAKFVELLDRPPQPNEGLRKLLLSKAPWEA